MTRVDVYNGDSREILKVLVDGSIDACVTDPPYALVSIGKRFGSASAEATADRADDPYRRASAGFMGQRWDTGETAFDPGFWREVWRVLKPGAHLVAFSGTRTYHRMACAIEDAGFDIRDMTAWLYGSGFPKSHDVAKGIDAYLGETGQVVARGDPVRRMVPGADQARDGWLKQRGREFQPGDYVAATPEAAEFDGWGTALKPALEPICLARKPPIGSVARNVLAFGTGALNIEGCRVGDDGGVVDAGARCGANADSVNVLGNGNGLNGRKFEAVKGLGRWPANVLHDGSDEVLAAFPPTTPSTIGKPRAAAAGEGWGMTRTGAEYADAGSAARFFYSAKADVEDRLGSDHPTVKPVDLMQWLVRLITPPGGVVLDPFGGSGTTALAAMNEGRDAILIEREARFADDIRRRVAWARGEGGLTAQEVGRSASAKRKTAAAMPLFGDESGVSNDWPQ